MWCHPQEVSRSHRYRYLVVHMDPSVQYLDHVPMSALFPTFPQPSIVCSRPVLSNRSYPFPVLSHPSMYPRHASALYLLPPWLAHLLPSVTQHPPAFHSPSTAVSRSTDTQPENTCTTRTHARKIEIAALSRRRIKLSRHTTWAEWPVAGAYAG